MRAAEAVLRETQAAPLANTFGIRAHAKRLIEVDDIKALPAALQAAGRGALLLGSGSNLLFVAPEIEAAVRVADARIDAVDINADAEGQAVRDRNHDDDGDDGNDDIRVRVAAGARWHDFVMHALAQGWHGLENLALIPGTVGAAPIQNIGAYGVEVMDRITAVRVHDRETGQTRWWPHAACGFSYRDSAFKADPQRHAVLQVEFRLSRRPRLQLGYAGLAEELQAMGITQPTACDVAEAVIAIRRRKLPNPARIGNAGSFFKNPIVDAATADALHARHPGLPLFRAADAAQRKLSAAWLIDACGWKGHRDRDGDAGVSPDHALVLVNHGHASGAELLALARRIAGSVRERFGIDIEPEPRVIGAQW